ncbi:hypothetical protein BEL04_14055 [Mucilaginibacter sp. PPCGB 2223]|uniref:DUF4349 domain-containing protein n=1 Tax=Mucilaginibacter sp. PPCGB 2223 TaxID=1886027 RepID=UPI0008269AA1|nr:DUF4349 domain-containing protein [Mucilaginibacter sp. PPCGB 2223]OCX52571.1 hypothetical protein BEL04_14055 [Mucilaginibacter sp. PPCGB 2223]
MKTKIICLGACFAIFLAACSGRKEGYNAANATDSTAVYTKSDTSASPKLIKTANMHFKVKNVQRACEDVTSLTTGYGGLVMHHTMQSSLNKNYESPISRDSVLHVSSYNTTADMTLRIPSGKMEEFMNMVGRMAMYIDARNMDIEDKKLDYLSAGLKMKNQTDIVKHQNAAANQGQNIQSIKNDLIDEKVNARRIDSETKYSTISLTFYQTNTIVKEVTVNDDPSSFREPFLTQLGNSMATGWSGLNDVVVFLANGWVLFVLAAIAWYGYFMYKRKQTAKVA